MTSLFPSAKLPRMGGRGDIKGRSSNQSSNSVAVTYEDVVMVSDVLFMY